MINAGTNPLNEGEGMGPELRTSDWFLVGGGRAYRKPKNGADHPHVLTKKADSRKQPKNGRHFFWGLWDKKDGGSTFVIYGLYFFHLFGFGEFFTPLSREMAAIRRWPSLRFSSSGSLTSPCLLQAILTMQPVLDRPPLSDLLARLPPESPGWGGGGNFTESL